MKRPLLAVLLFAALQSPLRADDGFGEFKAEVGDVKLKRTPPPLEAPTPDPMFPQAAQPAPAVSGDADLALFFKRLEDMGFDTTELRALAKKLSVEFRSPGGDAYAEWGYFRKVLYIPFEFKEKDGNRIRYDLAANDIDTLIHEFTHAERSLTASEDAGKGTVGREHYEAVKDIWADLRSRSLLYRYAWMKADEVSGYFMGAAISHVFEAADEIVVYNVNLEGSKAEPGQGGKLLIPDKATAKDPWSIGFATQRYDHPFGRSSVYDSASFKENALFSPELIHWSESDYVKDRMYQNILGLKPPQGYKGTPGPAQQGRQRLDQGRAREGRRRAQEERPEGRRSALRGQARQLLAHLAQAPGGLVILGNR